VAITRPSSWLAADYPARLYSVDDRGAADRRVRRGRRSNAEKTISASFGWMLPIAGLHGSTSRLRYLADRLQRRGQMIREPPKSRMRRARAGARTRPNAAVTPAGTQAPKKRKPEARAAAVLRTDDIGGRPCKKRGSAPTGALPHGSGPPPPTSGNSLGRAVRRSFADTRQFSANPIADGRFRLTHARGDRGDDGAVRTLDNENLSLTSPGRFCFMSARRRTSCSSAVSVGAYLRRLGDLIEVCAGSSTMRAGSASRARRGKRSASG